MKGSVGEGMIGSGRAERPKTLRGRLRNVYEPKDDSTTASTGDSSASTNANASSVSLDKSLAILSPFDEQEEWAKINEIMASFGTGLVRESVFVTELEKEFQARLGLSRSESTVDSPCSASGSVVTSVAQWLSSLGLSDYESLFNSYGFDHPDFINGVLEEKHLKEMGITNEKDRTAILESSRNLPCKVRDAFVINSSKVISVNSVTNSISNSMKEGSASDSDDAKRRGLRSPIGPSANAVADRNGSANADAGSEPSAEKQALVDEWLGNLRLEEYRDTFRRHLYLDMEKVKSIWDVELITVLEIDRSGHRQRILNSLPDNENNCGGRSQHAPNIDDINADLSQLKSNIQQLKEEIRVKLPTSQPSGSGNTTGTASNTGTLRHSHKKSRPAPPPPPGAVAAADLEIRAPSELLVGVPATLTTQWRHQAKTLLVGQVTYVASYLGSTVVRDMRGTESTKKSIQKLKKSTTNEEKIIPEIILSISYRGVRFLNALNQELVCEHEIRNIHCACQDAEDLTHFAYITKDHASKSHYCHVFCVQTMDQATEVILTLGQAFEVAYQMALRENFGTVSRLSANNNGHMRSKSVNQIGDRQMSLQQQSPVNCQPVSSTSTTHARSHSINEIKIVNGSGLSMAQHDHHRDNGINHRAPTPTGSTPDRRAPIVMTDDI